MSSAIKEFVRITITFILRIVVFLCCLYYTCTYGDTIWYSSLSSGVKDANWEEGGAGEVIAEDNSNYCRVGSQCYSIPPFSWIFRSIDARNYNSVTLKLTASLHTPGQDLLYIYITFPNQSVFLTTQINSDTSTSGNTYNFNECDGIECVLSLYTYSVGSNWKNEALVQDVYAQGTPNTISPTFYPSLFPTYIPTIIPTQLPTILPSKFPTEIPTVYPTKNPTIFPTEKPTMFPTEIPSYYPTLSPTYMPSKIPTYNPSLLPTAFPAQAITAISLISENGLVIIFSGVFVLLLIVISCFFSCRYVRKKRDGEKLIMNTFVDQWNVQKMKNEEKQENVNAVDELKNENISSVSINSSINDVLSTENIFTSNNVPVQNIVLDENKSGNENVDEYEINNNENEEDEKYENRNSCTVEQNMITTIGGITSTAKENDMCDEESESSDSSSDDDVLQNITLGAVDAREIFTTVGMTTIDIVDDGNINLLTDPALEMSVEGVEVDFIMVNEDIDVHAIGSTISVENVVKYTGGF